MAGTVAVRQVSELRSKGADIVAEAKRHPVELRRYGETVAYLVSPDRHERLQQLEEAAQRAYWGFVIARGLKSLEEGRVTEWDEATAARLRRSSPGHSEEASRSGIRPPLAGRAREDPAASGRPTRDLG